MGAVDNGGGYRVAGHSAPGRSDSLPGRRIPGERVRQQQPIGGEVAPFGLQRQTDVEGSAGYVAIEQVTGTLHGRSGTFVLQHSGLMTRGEPQLTIIVVPDSATGDLAGLSGTMTIEIEDGTHSYAFEYTLPAAP